MDTKSKKSEYPLIVKALCLVLTVLCALGTAACAGYGVLAAAYLPHSGSEPVSFCGSDLFREMVHDDLCRISSILYEPLRREQLETYRAQRDETIEAQVQRYLREKAALIRAEILYVATHYDPTDTDYYYDAYMRDFSTTDAAAQTEEPTQAEAETERAADASEPDYDAAPADGADLSALPEMTVDARAPYNVRYCQRLCGTVSGLNWLQYESIVRDAAFTERTFSPSFGDLGHRGSYTFNYSEQQIRTRFGEDYDELLRGMEYSGFDDDRAYLNSLRNFKYFAVARDGTVSSNLEKREQNEQYVLSHSRYILCRDGKVTAQMQDDEQTARLKTVTEEMIAPMDGTMFVCFEDTFVPGDKYADAQTLFDSLFVQTSPKSVLIAGVLCAVGAVFFFAALLCLCGHKSGVEGITCAFIDRVPTDVHLLVSAALILVPFILFGKCGYSLYETLQVSGSASDAYGLVFSFRLHAAVMLALLGWMIAVALEWLTSTVRIKKAGKSFFRGFVLWKLVRLVFRGLRFCLRKIAAGFRFLLDKPKKLRYLPFLVCALYLAAVLFIAFLSAAADNPAPVCLGVPVLTALLVLGAVWFLRMLDRIAESAEMRTDLPEAVTRKMPLALRQLAENLSVTNRELDKAVADAVRNERTKAELITNVSHDLKTPLTSVITYVDLLKKCGVTDEKALEYLDVLDEKSAKLKRLVEDLIEASKVNTGNITLQRVPLNLAELATQAVTEAAPDFEEQSLELKFTPPECAPIVFADGAKTYRILDNLLSNARKYSAPGSRVYAKVDEDEQFGVFEIKNTSREPLDIEPQELMERFVRGDRSRTQDGNGLGLSIAQQLCLLQGGRLEISIDGDLFKATVYLPKHRSAEESVTQV